MSYTNNFIKNVQQCFHPVSGLITNMEKFLDSDLRRAVQFQGNTVQKKGNTVICTGLPFSGTVLHFSYILC